MERKGTISIEMQTGAVAYIGDASFFAGDNNSLEIEVTGETQGDVLAVVEFLALNQSGGLYVGNCKKNEESGMYVINGEDMDSVLAVVGDVVIQFQLYNEDNERITTSENIQIRSCLNLDRHEVAFIDASTFIDLKELIDVAEAIRKGGIIPGGGGGVTFIPYVSPEGVISWTNNGGMPNPEPVNIKGADGVVGRDGRDGTDGRSVESVAINANNHLVVTYSDATTQDAGEIRTVKGDKGDEPEITITPVSGGYSIAVDGVEKAVVTNGVNGQDGFSPAASVERITGGAKITITDKNGTTTATVNDGAQGAAGADGNNGNDGFSPVVAVSDIPGGHRVTITDASGDHVFNVMDGDGVGVDYTEEWDEARREITLSDGVNVQRLKLTNVALLSDIKERQIKKYTSYAEVQENNPDFSSTRGEVEKVEIADNLCIVFWNWRYTVGSRVEFAWHQVGAIAAKFRPDVNVAASCYLGSTSETVGNVFVGSSAGAMQLRLNKTATINAGAEFLVTGCWLTSNMDF